MVEARALIVRPVAVLTTAPGGRGPHARSPGHLEVVYGDGLAGMPFLEEITATTAAKLLVGRNDARRPADRPHARGCGRARQTS